MLSQTSAIRIIKLYKETCGTEPRPRSYGTNPVISEEKTARIKQEIDADSSTTIHNIMDKLQLSNSRDAVCDAIRRLGIPIKKNAGPSGAAVAFQCRQKG
jgi:transposase